MISMSKQNHIRQLWRQGDSVSEIARKTGVCRDTAYKYVGRGRGQSTRQRLSNHDCGESANSR